MPFLLFIFSFLLYIFTFHPFFSLGDSGEFITVAKTFGVSHPPGAAFYSILSYIFAAIPIGQLIFRLNLLSAIFGSLSVVLVYYLLQKITKKTIPAILGSMFLAVSGLFWTFATTTELYTMALFFILLLITIFNEWLLKKEDRFQVLIFFTGALCLMVHYATISAVLPIFVATLIIKGRTFIKPKIFLLNIVGFLLGLLPIMILPIAASHNAIINWDNPSNFNRLMQVLSRNDYKFFGLGQDTGGVELFSLFQYYIKDLITSFSLVGVVLAVIGISLRKKSLIEYIILACFLMSGPIYVIFTHISPISQYPDIALNHQRIAQHYYVFSYIFIAIFIGMGINFLLNKFKKYKIFSYSFFILIFTAFLYTFYSNYLTIFSGNNKVFLYYGENVLQNIHKPTIVIIGGDNAYIFDYLIGVKKENVQNTYLISFSFLQKPEYVNQLKKKYPDIYIPFKAIAIGQNLDDFYIKNLNKFDIIFAPFTDTEQQSVSNKFTLLPYGLTTKLIAGDASINQDEYIKDNYVLDKNLIGKSDLVKKYIDMPTKETLMSFSLSYTNIALRLKKMDKTSDAIYFLQKAEQFEPEYFTSFLIEADMYNANKQYTKAIEVYNKMLLYNPNNPQALKGLLIAYYQNGNKDKAKIYAEKYVQFANTDETKNEAQQILQYLNNGDSLIFK